MDNNVLIHVKEQISQSIISIMIKSYVLIVVLAFICIKSVNLIINAYHNVYHQQI